MKNLLLFLFFSIYILGVNAQENDKSEKKQINFSPELTLSLNIQCHELANEIGFGAGVYNAFFNQKRCNLIVGLEYNNLIQRHFNINDYDTKFPIFYNYLGIPAYFRVNMGKKVCFFIDAGIFFDFLVFERVKLTKNDIKTDYKMTHYIHKPDFGISGGIGLRIPIKEFEILLKNDYKLGMKRFYDFSKIAFYNQYIRFTVGFKANFPKKRNSRYSN